MPLGSGDVDAEGRADICVRGRGLPELHPETADGPEVLRVLRLVVDPSRGRCLPAAGFPVLAVLEVDFVVQVELEHRLIPAFLGEVAGEAGGRARELAPVLRAEGVFDPVAAFEMLLVVHRPVLVERQVERFGRHLAARQVGEGRAVGERAEAGIPGGPVEGFIRLKLRRGGHPAGPAVGEDVER